MAFSALLNRLRRDAGLSQERLSALSGVSQRQISILESGRARPGRATLVKLAGALDLSAPDTVHFFLAAGHAPPSQPLDLSAASFAPVQHVLERALAKHAPYPGLVCERGGRIMAMNRPLDRLLRLAGGGEDLCARSAGEDGPNLYDLIFQPAGLLPFMVNREAILAFSLARLRGASLRDRAARRTLDRIGRLAHMEALAKVHTPRPGPVLLERYRVGATPLDFISMTASFGAPEDPIAERIQLDLFYPATEETIQTLDELALGTHDAERQGPAPIPLWG